MPSYFGHEMSKEELERQILADDLALEFVRTADPDQRAGIMERIQESGMRREMWEDTLARARRYVG